MQFDTARFELDGISHLVAVHTVKVLQFFGCSAAYFPHDFEASMRISFNGETVCRIIEGCNAVSVMILFASFIFAFSSTFKKTLGYIIFGVLIIYILNITRIAILTYLLYYYPSYQEILHGTVFPLFIYGVVFVLWILWVTKFSGHERMVK